MFIGVLKLWYPLSSSNDFASSTRYGETKTQKSSPLVFNVCVGIFPPKENGPSRVLSNDSTCHGGFRAPHFDPEEDEEALRGVDEMFLPCSLAFPECNRTVVFFVSISPRHLYPLYAMLHVVRGCENRQYSCRTPKTAPPWWCTRYVQAAESICVPNERISCATVLLIRRVDQTDFTADIEISRMIDTG